MNPACDAVILCGGRGSRMGGRDKGLLPWRGQPLAVRMLACLRPWPLDRIWLSANRHLDIYAGFGCTVLNDMRSDFPGPLAGIEAALSASRAETLLVVPCDVPRLPDDLLPRLQTALETGVGVAYAADAERDHPGICLLRREQLAEIQRRLDRGERSLWRWQAAIGAAAVRFEFDFPNLNDPAAWVAELNLVLESQ